MFARSLDLDATSTFEDEILTRFSEVCDTQSAHMVFLFMSVCIFDFV